MSSPHLHLPSFNYATRSAVLRIYQQFTVRRALLLDRISHPVLFMQSVLTAVEGEVDPRNLLISLDLCHFMLATFMQPESPFVREGPPELVGQLSESFFDQVSAYFPINFKPPEDDKFKVTPESLKAILNKCILASPLLLGSLVPFLVDKLSAKLISAKADTLDVLERLVSLHEAKHFQQEKESLLSQVLSEVSNLFFNLVDDAIQDRAALTIAKTLSSMMGTQQAATGITFVQKGSADSLAGEAYQFLARCVQTIEDSPESVQAGLSSLILKTAVKTSKTL